MVPFMVDRLWRAVSMVFVEKSQYSTLPTLARSKIPHLTLVFNSLLEDMSGPGALPGFRQYSTYFAIS